MIIINSVFFKQGKCSLLNLFLDLTKILCYLRKYSNLYKNLNFIDKKFKSKLLQH